MTGWRIGWLLVPDELLDSVDRLAGNFTICPPALSQLAAVAAFEAYDELDANVARYADNRARLLEQLPAIGLDRLAPADGAFYVYADVSRWTTDSVAFAQRLLAETGVALAPGVDFDPVDGGRFVRLCFAGDGARDRPRRAAARRLARRAGSALMPAAQRPTPGTQTRVADEDWALDDLSGRTESGVEYVRLDLAETTSSGGLVFEECVFRDVGFDLAQHTAAAFLNCVFVQCRFPNAVFRECKFVGSSFERCELGRDDGRGRRLVVRVADRGGPAPGELRRRPDARVRPVRRRTRRARRWCGATPRRRTGATPSSTGATCAAPT